MSDHPGMMSEAAIAELRAQGYKLAYSEFGSPASGKTTRARAVLNELRRDGWLALINDGIWRDERGGVEIWAKRP